LLSQKHSKIGTCTLKAFLNSLRLLLIIAILSSGVLHKISHFNKLVELFF
jgi:hypothetical protein